MANRECKGIGDLLTAYVEGELDPVLVERVAAHLEGCATCRADEADLRIALPALRSASRRTAPAELDRLVLDAVRRTPARSANRRWQPALAGAASVLLVGLVAGALLWQSSPTVQPTLDRLPHPPGPQVARTGTATMKPQPAADRSASQPGNRTMMAAATQADGDVPAPPRRHVVRRSRTGMRNAVLRVACVDEKVRVGDALTSLYGEAGYDESGKIALISVRADTEAAYAPSAGGAEDEVVQ